MLKPYQTIPIQECGEPIIPIPLASFAVVIPHPYQVLGAPYSDKSPFYLRQGVVDRLLQAQQHLHDRYPGWKIQIFDAYRPVVVQTFMVNYTFDQEVQSRGWQRDRLTASQETELWEQVHQFWAVPSLDPATPPPHSTGAAIDVTLVDDQGQAVDMGSPIDEISPRSYPDYFAGADSPTEQQFQEHRERLHWAMATAGFERHHKEWWHFSFGDQVWAWLRRERQGDAEAIAQYGRI